MFTSSRRDRTAMARVCITALLASSAMPALAGIDAVDRAVAEGSATQTAAAVTPEIIVVGERLLRDVRPERDLDEAAISTYGVSTIDELVGAVEGELDSGEDDEPLLLVNGERIHDLDEIGAYPVEALRRLRLLPRGSASRLGGKAGQRVITLTLHRQMRSATVTLAPRLSTEGGGQSHRGETILTHIRGQTRANVAFRIRDEDALFESERDIIQPEPRLPFARGGNVIAYPDLSGEIDPLLSDLGGRIITVAPIPRGTSPVLADFATAGLIADTDLGDFRTLRPEARTYEINASFGTRLLPWLRSSATVRLGRSASRSQRGLASGLFLLDSENPFSPFSEDVALAFYRDDRALDFRSTRYSGEANLSLNANVGQWRASLNGRHTRARDSSRSDRSDQAGPLVLADGLDPFATDLGEMIAIRTDRSRAKSRGSRAQLSFSGPAFKLPAGPVSATVEGRIEGSRIRSLSSFSAGNDKRGFARSERFVRLGVEVPIASARNNVLPFVGELSASADLGRGKISGAGSLDSHTLGLTWHPRPPIRLRAALESTTLPAAIQLLGNPVLITPAVRTFDVLTGDTVDVTQITGGNPMLEPQRKRTWRASAIVRLAPRLGLQLSSEYIDSNERNLTSFLPPASAAVQLAFPDRFVRDASGRLVTVDLRPVNFAAQRQQRLRYGLSLNAPLGGGAPRVAPSSAPDSEDDDDAPPPPPPTSAGPRTRLVLSANHSIVLRDEIEIRPRLNPVDLLRGGAIGIGGGRVRHQIDSTAGITSGGLGGRVSVTWRGPSQLETRINGQASALSFSPLLLVNLRAFADLRRFLPQSSWSDGLRLSLNVTNVANQRQRVRDSGGDTPLQYKPAYRDPLGRAVEFEIRKVF